MNHLMSSRRFLPLFITQFLGAFNDNLFKNALVILVTYKIAASDSAYSAQLVNLAFGLFVLPMFAFSYLSGQISDKIDRAQVARWVKLTEIALAISGSAGLFLGNIPLLLLTLFGFGTHSSFFGPVKYAILPQHLQENELIAGNGYVEAGTFLAILTGTILGGVLVLTDHGIVCIAGLMTILALLGYIASRQIPAAPAPLPGMKLALNPVRGTIDMIRFSAHRRDEFLCILGISWFWLLGTVFLAQFSPFAKDVLHADEHVVTLFLVAFSIGIAVGSILCARLIKGLVRATHVPLGALGMTVFAVDLYFASRHAAPAAGSSLLSLMAFLRQATNLRVLFDLFAIAVCGGIYIVPLYALLQVRADKDHGARAIASNNLMNALFMVAAAGLALGLIKLGFTIPQIFLTVAILNVVVAIYICKLLPFSLIAALLKLVYRVEVRGLENYAKAGNRVLIIANHTSYLDAAVIAAFLPERVCFAVNTFVARRWWIRPFLKLVDAFPLDPTNPMATKSLIDKLKQNQKCMIFPEGRITMTGSLMKIYEGPGMIADKSGAMILPIRIDGAQYSPLSRLRSKVRIRWFPKVTLTFLPPRQFSLPEDIKGRRRRQLAAAQLYDLMSQMIFDSSPVDTTLMKSLVEASRIHGGNHVIVEDQKREPVTYKSFIAKSLILAGLVNRVVAGDEKHIGLLLPNMSATAVAFFAVQSLGRVTAMLNFTAGPAQILSACKAAELRTVITSKQFIGAGKLTPVVEAIQSIGVRVVYLEDLQARIGFSGKIRALFARWVPGLVMALSAKTKPDDPAVMLFTSGSEGTPKGVLLSHRNLLANRFQLGSRIDFGPQDIVFNCLPMFHAFGLTGGTLLPLLSGIKTFLYPSPLHYRIVPELIYDTNATILFGTDTFLGGYARFANPYDFYALRYVFAGAEKLKEETRRAWFDKFGIRIFEGYGATETAPVLSVNTAMHYRAGTVGRFMPGIQVKFESVPGIDQGQKLLVKGPNVMMGYMRDDAPGVLRPLQDGWYDTGDIVAIDEDGFVTIQGRTKRFAKIGGEMVSLTAVETAISKLWPNINHVVVSVPDPRKGEMLVLVTEHAGAELDVLPSHFRQNGLTELSIPRRLVKLDKLPLLGTGKADYVQIKARILETIDAQ
ncbi:MAG: acyl-[ACP]--phospholipid O-acyltransferase [Alphaproteobacteria bacterium]|nr:acyl-[ACP]--phospholipid O-acyltransferase [Alphaproteobacteria bacterium]